MTSGPQKSFEEQALRLKTKDDLAAELQAKVAQLSIREEALQAEARRLRETLTGTQLALDTQKSILQKAEEARLRVESEKLRLHTAREELVQRLVTAERRAQEAEEEQLRLEQEFHSSSIENSSRNHVQETSEERESQGEQTLRAEVEMERQRAAVLVAALNSAKKERDKALSQLREASERLSSGRSPGQPAYPPDKPFEQAVPSSQQHSDQQIHQLKMVRDKLMQELDEQNDETERLAAENAALTQALMDARKLCGAWENQANDGILQIDRLKDLLEESSLWQSPSKLPAGSHAAQTGAAEGTAMKSISDADKIQELESQLMEEKSRSAQLDLYVKAMAAEISRTTGVTADLRNATLPMLTGVQERLKQLLNTTSASLKVS